MSSSSCIGREFPLIALAALWVEPMSTRKDRSSATGEKEKASNAPIKAMCFAWGNRTCCSRSGSLPSSPLLFACNCGGLHLLEL